MDTEYVVCDNYIAFIRQSLKVEIKSNSLYFIYLYLEKSNYMYVGESAPMIFDQN